MFPGICSITEKESLVGFRILIPPPSVANHIWLSFSSMSRITLLLKFEFCAVYSRNNFPDGEKQRTPLP